MKTYDIFALIVIPLTIFLFSIDYLSNKDIVHSEVKSGVFIALHHLLFVLTVNVFLFAIINRDPKLLLINATINLISQVGWIINNDFCFITKFQNILINKNKPNRLWRGSPDLLLKHYFRGDEWAYKDYSEYKNDKIVLFGNIGVLIWCMNIIRHGSTR